MRKPWMTDAFIGALEDAENYLDRATEAMLEAIDIARDVWLEDGNDAEEAGDMKDELDWEIKDEIESISYKVFKLLDELKD